MAFGLAPLASGCTSGMNLPLNPASAAAVSTDLKAGVGDQIRVAVYGEAELSGTYVVQPNGTISYPLLGETKVEGLAMAELAALIAGRLRAEGLVNDPRVSAELAAYRDVFVLGEVGRAGRYPYVIGMTVDAAVASAGGYSYRAKSDEVILRRAGSNEMRRFSIDPSQPIAVLPGDVIQIPERYF